MAKLHPFVRDWLAENKRLYAHQKMRRQMRAELQRLVLEAMAVSKDGNTRQARALLAKADRLRRRLEHS